MKRFKPKLFFILPIFFVFPFVVARFNQAKAATINVDTTVDSAADGQCSLREAIDAANTDAVVDGCSAGDDLSTRSTTWGTMNGDVINIPAGTYTLTLAGVDDTNAGGDLDVWSTIFFIGDPDGTTIDASAPSGSGDRVLDILPLSSYTYLESVEFTGGEGGIGNNGTYLQTWNIVIGNNTATTDGGGIYLNGTDAIINNSQVGSNTGTNGGGIYIASGSASIMGVGIGGNTATVNGGGIYIASGVTAKIGMGTQVSGNHSNSIGGGIYNAGTVQPWSSSDVGFTINENTAVGNGGGVANANGAVFTTPSNPTLSPYNRNIISDNATNSDGGGISNFGTVNLYRTYIANNTAIVVNGKDGRGGGIFDDSSNNTTNIWDSWVIGNEATYGGGVYILSSSLNATRSAFTGNSATGGNGDGLLTNGSSITLINSTVSGNDEDGIRSTDGTSIELSFTTISNHTNYAIFTTLGDFVDFNTSIIDDTCEVSNATVTSGGYNIETGTTCSLSHPTDMVGVSSTDLNLGALSSNGGYSNTHALLEGSVAIDHIPEASCTVETDQRGEGRPDPMRNLCDVGAFELQQILPETGSFTLPPQILGILIVSVSLVISRKRDRKTQFPESN